jgi:hypothetical protein
MHPTEEDIGTLALSGLRFYQSDAAARVDAALHVRIVQ